MRVEITHAVTEEDISYLADNMRVEDAAECAASGFDRPIDALRFGIEFSTDSWVCRVDGRVMGMFGIALDDVLSGKARLWLLTSDMADKRPIAFVQIAREALASISRRWPRLTLEVDTRHHRAIRFMRSCGFVQKTYMDHPVTGMPFRVFVKEA